ncbi:conjugal transfer protein TraD [Flavobacterium rakeshii]|uniref:conjugal transfer protein TraD n=1 Tax=Flavobacterium rakeshii TaxID=1038845 RepID=UPI002E7B6E3C|nr:conjugal transfer protein TraD [Flavobacterium rakeshii]MEE1897013.1 conjugal transfer protein TraD [Flavobacterium rakeshii]
MPGVTDIMGRPKLGGRTVLPTQDIEAENDSGASVIHNFDTVNKRETKIPIPQEEPDEDYIPDWDDEEEEMKGYASNAVNSIEDGLATGVTYDELATMGQLLQRKALKASEKKSTVSLASKIDGTELMFMLEIAVGDASKKIAMLLDRADDHESDSGSSNLRNYVTDEFDIGDFI